ncbi:ABC transporter ATP-binding protein [Flavisolibacter tropicus]|uniref:ABC transporter ATP-binding protein n=1 Tax=Flavisolibacter tropicus TaxID=1492898 RepID=A0A172TU44_9BACT|nr:ABC transporter ATP-binding protein [Flavisolibacter tropicus]ANE50267.1 ABC transporter ATP-binding protein [Flavisolibacter tropicus]
MQPLLQIIDLSIDFFSESGTTHAVKNLSLSVNRGEIVALVGESGSGKSVTSLSILQLIPAPPVRYTSGTILFTEKENSIDILKLQQKELQALRGHKIAMIFQEPMTSLNPVMTCGKQVAEALLQHKQLTKEAAKQKVIEWFAKVKLPNPEAMYHRYPHQLSGGQKQRVMIAMAMCCEPSLLICDEPTTALDVTVQKTILELIKELQQEQNMGVIFITHDLGVVAEIADRVAILYKGDLVEQGKTKDIFTSAKHPYTKALIACRPALHPKGERLPIVSDFLENKIVSENKQEKEAKKQADEVLVSVKNLLVQFPTHTNLFGKVTRYYTAVDHVSLDIKKGETVGLVGESGCGKTTLGRTLLRLIDPTSGQITYDGTDITKLTKQQLKDLRQQVQLVFQDPYSSLNPRLTIGAALAEPMAVTGLEPNKKEQQKRVAELLDRVNLPSAVARRYPHEFSGGQRQRIVIARALALNPTFLVCDESVSALDVSVQAQVLNLLNDLKKDLGLTMLFISHDLSVVRYMSDRIMVMNKGQIIETGNAEDVYHHPQSEYTQRLLAAIPKVKAY